MRTFNSSALRTSVCSVAAVAVISLIAWSFESYRNHLWESTNGTTASIHVLTTSDADSRNA